MSQYGATKEAAECLKAQLDAQDKLTTPKQENRKIRNENEIVKAKEHAPDLSIGTKRHTSKSCETIPLKYPFVPSKSLNYKN
jgi:hypothetical protein